MTFTTALLASVGALEVRAREPLAATFRAAAVASLRDIPEEQTTCLTLASKSGGKM